MRYGLLFGSFNPIHNAHIQIANRTIERGLADIVWFVPAKQNPFKNSYEISDTDRLAMIRQVIKYPLTDCCMVEFSGELESTKTYDVYQYIKSHCSPKDSLVIICGLDTYTEIPSWYRGNELLKEDFLIYGRNSSDISSSYIRERIKSGQDFKDLVPESVYKYIKSNNLYVNSAKTQGAEAN
jgi:nicotinate-nucleotide adenylyltransferase